MNRNNRHWRIRIPKGRWRGYHHLGHGGWSKVGYRIDVQTTDEGVLLSAMRLFRPASTMPPVVLVVPWEQAKHLAAALEEAVNG